MNQSGIRNPFIVTAVNRDLKTLNHLGLVTQTSNRKYSAGPGVHVLSALSLQGSSLLQAAMPHARTYWERGYALTLGVLWHQHLCFLIHARPEYPFEESIAARDVTPAPQSSAGMALLAHRPEVEVSKWTFEQPKRVKEPVSELPAQLAEVRQNGFATRHYTDGIVSVGVPVGNPPVAGLAISKPSLSKKETARLAAELQETAEEIVSKLR